jgi:hypothetical protein
MNRPRSAEVNLDFLSDFRQIVEQVLAANGIAVDPNESYEDAVYRLFANVRRRIELRRYRVVEAKELACPTHLAAGYAELRSELERGVDVTDRLSTRISRATYEDGMLNDWGITHFHLGLRGAGNGLWGDEVLFATVRGDVVYCIGFFEHGSWTNVDALEIVHRNWPDLIEQARVRRVTVSTNRTDEERAQLRAAGIVALINVNGVMYAPAGGG